MPTIEYIKKKNEILMKYLGILLVPDSQLRDIPVTSKMLSDMSKFVEDISMEDYMGSLLTLHNCPYCTEYFRDPLGDCERCPMYLDGNHCKLSDSTYADCHEITLDEAQENALKEELLDLAKSFIAKNKTLKGNQLLISKQLLGEIMQLSINTIESGIPKEYREPIETHINFTVQEKYGEIYSINKHELAAKAKKWAYLKSGYSIVSSFNSGGSYAYLELENACYNPQKVFMGDTEPDSIFLACEWIVSESQTNENKQKEKQ